MNLGLIGLGSLGQVHLKNFASFEGVKVIALADKDPERRKGIFGQADVNISELNQDSVELPNLASSYADYNDLCKDNEIDAVCISLPTFLHADAAIKALEAGKHVFCEKPMALTLQDAERMVHTAKTSGKILMIGQVLRFWGEYVKAFEIFSSGKYGNVLAASFYRYGGMPTGSDNWFFDENKSGGAVIDLHLHDVDACIWWWGRPDSISAGGAYRLECPNIVHSRWYYENGPSVQFECFWDANFPFNCGFRVIMENATLYYDYESQKGLQLITPDGSEIVEKADASDAYLTEDKYFLDCISTHKPVDRCPPEENLQALDVAVETSRQIQMAMRKISTKG